MSNRAEWKDDGGSARSRFVIRRLGERGDGAWSAEALLVGYVGRSPQSCRGVALGYRGGAGPVAGPINRRPQARQCPRMRTNRNRLLERPFRYRTFPDTWPRHKGRPVPWQGHEQGVRTVSSEDTTTDRPRAQAQAMRTGTRKTSARSTTTRATGTRATGARKATTAKRATAAKKTTATRKAAPKRATAAKKPVARKTATRATAARKTAKPATRKAATRKPADAHRRRQPHRDRAQDDPRDRRPQGDNGAQGDDHGTQDNGPQDRREAGHDPSHDRRGEEGTRDAPRRRGQARCQADRHAPDCRGEARDPPAAQDRHAGDDDARDGTGVPSSSSESISAARSLSWAIRVTARSEATRQSRRPPSGHDGSPRRYAARMRSGRREAIELRSVLR